MSTYLFYIYTCFGIPENKNTSEDGLGSLHPVDDVMTTTGGRGGTSLVGGGWAVTASSEGAAVTTGADVMAGGAGGGRLGGGCLPTAGVRPALVVVGRLIGLTVSLFCATSEANISRCSLDVSVCQCKRCQCVSV